MAAIIGRHHLGKRAQNETNTAWQVAFKLEESDEMKTRVFLSRLRLWQDAEKATIVMQLMPYLYTSDAYSPREIAAKVEAVSVVKANATFMRTFMLGTMAGGFIGLGAVFYTFIAADASLSPVVTRLLGGLFFAVGYLIALLAGAEVFTSNNLIVMAVAARKISLAQLFRNWLIVLFANAVGAIGLAVLFLMSGLHREMDGAVGSAAYQIGAAKASLPPLEAFSRAVLGNLFVCVAVWISIGGRSVADKMLGAILPLSALGALSLEHIVASLYYIPRSLLLAVFFPEYVSGPPIGVAQILGHALPVVAGNIVGGSFMVAIVYHIIYRRQTVDPE
ncbi:MAG: formate/nitrite transporter family protein [Luteolibacter sp.]